MTTVDASWLFVFIGAEPRTDWLEGVVERDERGFVVTGPDLVAGRQAARRLAAPRDPYHLEASVPGVFAAGDVRAESVKRVASAVGEGAMAVRSCTVTWRRSDHDGEAGPGAVAHPVPVRVARREGTGVAGRAGRVERVAAGTAVYAEGEPRPASTCC